MAGTDPGDFDTRLQEAKLRALAEFAAGAGHEINNPVATIVGHVQLLLAGETDPERRNALSTIGAQAYRIRDMIGDVMLFARPPQMRPVSVDLGLLAREVVAKLEADAQRGQCRVEVHADRPVLLSADPIQLQVVVSNLIHNGINALLRGGTIFVDVSSTGGGPARQAILTVSDDGPGLNDIEREHLFDPFFSGRQAGRGLGFGLAKCWRIVSLHGGEIRVETPVAGGTLFTVSLPAELVC